MIAAVIHNAILRYRDLYIAQIAICALIAGSPLLQEFPRRTVGLAALSLLLLVTLIRVGNYVQRNYLARYNNLIGHYLGRVLPTFHR